MKEKNSVVSENFEKMFILYKYLTFFERSFYLSTQKQMVSCMKTVSQNHF